MPLIWRQRYREWDHAHTFLLCHSCMNTLLMGHFFLNKNVKSVRSGLLNEWMKNVYVLQGLGFNTEFTCKNWSNHKFKWKKFTYIHNNLNVHVVTNFFYYFFFPCLHIYSFLIEEKTKVLILFKFVVWKQRNWKRENFCCLVLSLLRCVNYVQE